MFVEQVFLKPLVVELFIKLNSRPYFAPFIPTIHESYVDEMIVFKNVEGTQAWWEGVMGTKKQTINSTFWIEISPPKHPYKVVTRVGTSRKIVQQTPKRGLHTPPMCTCGWKPTYLLGYP
jgi:hypothetical protein